MSTYYEVTAKYKGTTEILFGSFVRADCRHEIDAERDSWKSDGYKTIKIVSRETTDTPDKEVYKNEIVTSHQLFMQQCPSFNFEKGEKELLEHALKVSFVTKIEGTTDQYLINQDY